jgi:hypothetical protein
LVGKPQAKIPLGRLRNRWEDTIKMDIKEITGRMWNQDIDCWRALVKKVMKFRVS